MIQMKTIRDMEFNRPTENNQGLKAKLEASGIRVQVAENGREIWWYGLDKTQQVAKTSPSIAMPMEMVPQVVEAMLDYVRYYDQKGKTFFIPTAGKDSGKKSDTLFKIITVNREERGEIVFALIAATFSPEAQKAKLYQPANFKALLVEGLQAYVNSGKAGEDLRKRHGGKVGLLEVMTDLWPLPQQVEKVLLDNGVRICSIGVQQWVTQSEWAIDDNLIGDQKEEQIVPDERKAPPEKTSGTVAIGQAPVAGARQVLSPDVAENVLNGQLASGTAMEGHPGPVNEPTTTVEETPTITGDEEAPAEAETTLPADPVETMPPPPPLPNTEEGQN